MNALLNLPLELRLAVLALVGALVGGQINRAIYRLAWEPRDISPWSAPPAKAPPRRWADRLPVFGWFGLRREAKIHGRGFWIRPLLIELGCSVGLAWLYDWQMRGGLDPDLPASLIVLPVTAAARHAVFLSHAILLGLMIVATFIDIDEKTIPDGITVPGTLVALILAAALPDSLLPVPVVTLAGAGPPVISMEPLRLTTPLAWPEWLGGAGGLAIGLCCYLGWCYAILPKTWSTRSGVAKAVKYLLASIPRHPLSWWIGLLAVVGVIVVVGVWWVGGMRWVALLSSLVGLAGGGGMIWAVRVVGTRALGREAMGFGDVTLMAMVGAFVGWQSAIVIFFISPFAGLVIAVAQYLLTRRGDIAYGPFLCAGTVALLLAWPGIYLDWVDPVFALGWLIPIGLAICLALMGGMLRLWRALRDRFAR